MSNVCHRYRRSKRPVAPEPDLFSWRPICAPDHGWRIASKIARQYGLSLPHAKAVAHLAGFRGVEA